VSNGTVFANTGKQEKGKGRKEEVIAIVYVVLQQLAEGTGKNSETSQTGQSVFASRF
jgi:hypothetical protein